MARRRRYRGWGGFAPYVPVAQRRERTARKILRARKRGEALDPVWIEGRKIATTAWGRAWCDHIEGFHDYSNRLPRGRTSVRNGSVSHLAILPGEIRARVMGSSPYEQRVKIQPCKPAVWKRVRQRCAGGIGSLIELLEGRISSQVMEEMTAERDGLLPDLKHVELQCSCPDWALLCKHLAAVLYGVGARLDERPELLFTLRGVDPAELVDGVALPGQAAGPQKGARRIEGNLSSVFGIELDEDVQASPPKTPRGRAKRTDKKTRRRTAATKPGSRAAKPGSRAAKPGSRAAKPAAPRRGRKVRRQELLEAGVPPGTIATWLRQGVLQASDERGVYRHTRESRKRLKRYGE